MVGCGYRPRTGSVFFTRNGKKLDDVTHTLKTQNLFPTVGATGPCSVHVNFGQMGFVFIEANVKKWGLAPMTGSLAPPPPYGSEAGSILLEGGKHGIPEGQGWLGTSGVGSAGSLGHEARNQGRSRSATVRLSRTQARSPGPERSPTDISLTQLSVVDSGEAETSDDPGEGTSQSAIHSSGVVRPDVSSDRTSTAPASHANPDTDPPPPEYESPDSDDEGAHPESRRSNQVESDNEYESTPHASTSIRSSEDGQTPGDNGEERRHLLRRRRSDPPSPPIPTYDAAVGSAASTESRVGQADGRERSPNR